VTGETALDELTDADAVREILSGQRAAWAAVESVSDSIIAALDVLVDSFAKGGRLLLIGAGTSGRLAAMEASEVPGTFGVAADRIQARCAGHLSFGGSANDASEDDVGLARLDMRELDVSHRDAVIAVAASGTTPYTVEAARCGLAASARVISVTTALGSPLAALATVAIEVPVGEEIIQGATRLAAGTAQKLVLNTLTTAMMVRLGRVHGQIMIDAVPANEKLIRRVSLGVASAANVSLEQGANALHSCGMDARAAVVLLCTGLDSDAAAELAHRHRTVREALASLRDG